MPRIPPEFTEPVFHLYGTEADARIGSEVRGTGFLVSVPVEGSSDHSFFYAVTNAHVVMREMADARVIRLSSSTGGPCIIACSEEDWTLHPDADDVAVAPLGLSSDFAGFYAVSRELLLNREVMGGNLFGPGNEVFFVTRRGWRTGLTQDSIVVRFGNVAALPPIPIPSPRGVNQESFLVEARSLGGYSGSPVFIYPGAFIETDGRWDFYMGVGTWLLGIDWSHISDTAPVKERDGSPVSDGWKVEQNTGLMGVVPAWKIAEILDDDDVIQVRDRVIRESMEGT